MKWRAGLHTRRKFHDIHVAHASPTTIEALARIGALYGIEEEVRGKPAKFRRDIRLARAKPLLEDLRRWMEKALHSLSTKSETAGAIRYALTHWRALTRYLENGLLEIDNNAAERALRTVAIGRNYAQFPIMRSRLGLGRWMALPPGATSASRHTNFA
jgi:transposase